MLAGYAHLIGAARRVQWDERAIALADDAARAPALSPDDWAQLAELVGGFCLAEQAVADELAPYVSATPPGSLERACFAMQQHDERRHARFFARVAREVVGADPARLATATSASLRTLFVDELPSIAAALARDADPATAAQAVGLYHLVLEGIVFAVGQEALLDLATRTDLTGVAAGVARVQGDERWHVGLGVLHLQRLGCAVDVGDAAARAARAWGPRVTADGRLDRALAAHERRLGVAGREVAGAAAGAGAAVTAEVAATVRA